MDKTEFVLVPREPTAAMLEAADVAMMTPETPHGGYIRGRSGTRIWKAMLSAAPQPNAVPLDDGSLRKLFKSATGYTPEEYEQMLREVKR